MRQDKEFQDFMRGAEMAYLDCAKWMRHLAHNMPQELAFVAPQFEEIAKAFEAKIGLMIKFADQEGGEQ